MATAQQAVDACKAEKERRQTAGLPLIDPPPAEDAPRALGDLATAYRIANRAACRAMKATCEAEEQASDRNHDEKRTARERDRAERQLIEALLDRFGGLPSIDRWWQTEIPLATVEADGDVFALVPYHDDAPDTREQCIERCRVVMIPAQAGPAAPPGDPRPTLAELARQALQQCEVGRQLFADHKHAEAESERLNDESCAASERATAARLEITRRVLELAGVGTVDSDEWFFGSRPVATVQHGSVLLVVSPANRDTHPRGVEGAALAPFCVLSIVPDMHGATETPEQTKRMDDWAAARGKRWDADGNLELIPVEPDPAEVAKAEQQAAADRARVRWIRQAHVIRCAKRWEKARNALSRVDSEPHPKPMSASWDSYVVARRLVEHDARQIEGLLGDEILRWAAAESTPGTPFASHDGAGRTRPAAVRIGGVIYTVVVDPTTQLNDDEPDQGTLPPIVARLEVGRVASMDAEPIGGGR